MEIEYLGLKLKPIGNIIGGWLMKCECQNWKNTITPKDYSYKDFYKLARRKHCPVDVYEIKGKLYIPTDSCFVGLTDKVYKHLKYVEEYNVWYNWAQKE